MRIRLCAVVLLVSVALPASGDWRATTPDAQEAVNHPRVAAALAAAMRVDEAILAGDADAFGAMFTADAVVNSPSRTVVTRDDAAQRLRQGLIDYASMERYVEHASLRGDHEVLLMGEEVVTPIGRAPLAGKTVRRRTTELWTDASGEWLLAARQATIYEVSDDGASEVPRSRFLAAKALKDQLYAERDDCPRLMDMFSRDVIFWENGMRMSHAFLSDYCPQLPPTIWEPESSEANRVMLGEKAAYEILVEELVDPDTEGRFMRTTTEIWREIDGAWKITHMNIGLHPLE